MEFVNWLVKHKRFSLRSARDVQSRLNRILKSTEKAYQLKEENLVNVIKVISDSPSIRSQLKRAIFLFKEYRKTFSERS
jgi:hypothetical protein